MSYQDVNFVNGTILPAINLNQIMDNIDYAREEANYWNLFAGVVRHEADTPGHNNERIDITVDGVVKETLTGYGDNSAGDIDISGLSVGIHTIGIGLTPGIAYGQPEPTLIFNYFKFFKSTDLNYFTIWTTLVDETNFIAAKDITIIGHRVAKAWV